MKNVQTISGSKPGLELCIISKQPDPSRENVPLNAFLKSGKGANYILHELHLVKVFNRFLILLNISQ